MNNIIKVKCPAKINLTLEVLNKRDDGYHNIKSVMQMIDLYDYLTISIKNSDTVKIHLSGSSDKIPYNEKNLVYQAIKLYLNTANIKNLDIDVYIEKNIPISAGLAGGSSDAAGTIWGLNQLLKIFQEKSLYNLCAQLGSDLNVCLKGGCNLATSRGEIIKNLPFINSDVTLIKPKSIGISAKEAYEKFSYIKNKKFNDISEKMILALQSNTDIKPYLYNDLEFAVFEYYKELQHIKQTYPDAIMSGSGSTYFVLKNLQHQLLDENYLLINNLKFIPDGVSVYSKPKIKNEYMNQ